MVQYILITFILWNWKWGVSKRCWFTCILCPNPTKDAFEVISVYSNAYSDVSASTYSASWGNANFDGNFAIGSDVLKYSALAFTGIEFASTFDISGKAYVHFDVWTPDNTTFNFKLVDYLSDGAWGSDNKEHEYTVSNLSQNQWTSVDIPLSDFTGLTSKEISVKL